MNPKTFILFALVVAIGVCTNVYAAPIITGGDYTVSNTNDNTKRVYGNQSNAKTYADKLFTTCKCDIDIAQPVIKYRRSSSSSSSVSSAASSSSSSVRTYSTLTFEPPKNVSLVTIKEYRIDRSEGESFSVPPSDKLMTVTPVKPFTNGEIVTVTAVYNNGTQSLPVLAKYE